MFCGLCIIKLHNHELHVIFQLGRSDVGVTDTLGLGHNTIRFATLSVMKSINTEKTVAEITANQAAWNRVFQSLLTANNGVISRKQVLLFA